MKSIRIVIVFLASILSLAGTSLLTQGQDAAQIRFVHLDAGSPALDVFVNGELAATDVTFGSATAYMRVAAGEVLLTANLATTSVQLIDQTLTLDADYSAAILSSRADGRFYIAADDLSQLAFGRARVTVFNAQEAVATVALGDPNDGPLAQAELSPGAGEGPFEVDAGLFQVFLRSSGALTDAAEHGFEAALHAGASHLLIIHGSQDDPQLLSVSAATEGGVGQRQNALCACGRRRRAAGCAHQ